MSIDRVEVGRITIGHVYRCHLLQVVKDGHEQVVMDVDMGLYEVVDFIKDGRSGQEHVLYKGVDSFDEGRRFHCSLNDFAVKFRLEQPLQLSPTVQQVEKKAGGRSDGRALESEEGRDQTIP